jgi:hypothetical protein
MYPKKDSTDLRERRLTDSTDNATNEGRWLLLIHQIPHKPSYFRVKMWRRLQRLGAVALKNSVYVLPLNDQAYEDFQWVSREIASEGGEASVCTARFVEGISDDQIEALFNTARGADYAEIAKDVKQLAAETARLPAAERRSQAEGEVVRLRQRFEDTKAIDFFAASEGEAAERSLESLEERLRKPSGGSKAGRISQDSKVRGATWVTRRSIHVDRMASAWLIRNFIDPEATFKFAGSRHAPAPGEFRFDMFEAEFTHEGDRCTFEVLLDRFKLSDPGLRAIAEIIHDIDLKDSKFGRPEAVGIDLVMTGITLTEQQDTARLERASAVLADLHAYFRRKSERDRRGRKSPRK